MYLPLQSLFFFCGGGGYIFFLFLISSYSVLSSLNRFGEFSTHLEMKRKVVNNVLNRFKQTDGATNITKTNQDHEENTSKTKKLGRTISKHIT